MTLSTLQAAFREVIFYAFLSEMFSPQHCFTYLFCSWHKDNIKYLTCEGGWDRVTSAVTGTQTCLRLAAHMLWYSWTDSGHRRDYIWFEVKSFRFFWNPELILNYFLMRFVSFICSSELRGWYQKMPGTDMVTKATEYVNKFNTSEGF